MPLSATATSSGTLKSGKKFIATVEPWHGFQIVVYTEPSDPMKLWGRHVIDERAVGATDRFSHQRPTDRRR